MTAHWPLSPIAVAVSALGWCLDGHSETMYVLIVVSLLLCWFEEQFYYCGLPTEDMSEDHPKVTSDQDDWGFDSL